MPIDSKKHLVPQQKYPPGCQKGFSHIMSLSMISLLYPAGPKPFILEECQKARKLTSCSSRGLQVQKYCVGLLIFFFWSLISSNCSQDCPACGQEHSCICLSAVRALLCVMEIMQTSHCGHVQFHVSIDKPKGRFLYNSSDISSATARAGCL